MLDATYRLLVVDDDAEIRSLLAQLLEKYSYQVATAANGEQMFSVLKSQSIDLIILDVMIPGEDGLILCSRIRKESEVPIIMLTAMGDDMDRIVGLEMGADDYLAKPFNPRELVARIKAVLRRSQDLSAKLTAPVHASSNYIVSFSGWTFDMTTRILISPEDVEISISPGEFELLKAFTERPLKVLSRDQLMDYTHNRQFEPFDRSIDVQVSRLRQKIEQDPKKPTLIKTVRGGGYMFTTKVVMKEVI